MGERKGTNHYYPPDFDPDKHRNLNAYHGTHALREKAKKIKQGIIIIRFEMPYNVWCEGCGEHIAMGVRYNAEKSKIGMYYTTPIWLFEMYCKLCCGIIAIKSDPANLDYVIIKGARRKEERWDPNENEQIVATDRDTAKKLALDSMYKLEHGMTDKTTTQKKTAPSINLLEAVQSVMKDDELVNRELRNNFRTEKKRRAAEKSSDDDVRKRTCLGIDLVKEQPQDKKLASLLKLRPSDTFEEKRSAKRREIINKPMFYSLPPPSSSLSSSSTSSSDAASHLMSSSADATNSTQTAEPGVARSVLIAATGNSIKGTGTPATSSSSSTRSSYTSPSSSPSVTLTTPHIDRLVEVKKKLGLTGKQFRSLNSGCSPEGGHNKPTAGRSNKLLSNLVRLKKKPTDS